MKLRGSKLLPLYVVRVIEIWVRCGVDNTDTVAIHVFVTDMSHFLDDQRYLTVSSVTYPVVYD